MGELLFISNVRHWQNSPRGGKCRLDSPMLGQVVNEFLVDSEADVDDGSDIFFQ